jgi:hypothetical protein
VNKQSRDDERKAVNDVVNYRIEMVAYRDKLDLDKQADLAAAQKKVFADDPNLYKRYRTANTVDVGVSRPRLHMIRFHGVFSAQCEVAQKRHTKSLPYRQRSRSYPKRLPGIP